MAYPFCDNDYPVYPKTFLKDVRIQLGHSSVNTSLMAGTDLPSFFAKHFNIKKITPDNIQQGLSIGAENGQIKIEFKDDSVLLLMKCPTYKSFELAMVLMKDVLEYFKTTGISSITQCVTSKYDEIEFKNNKNYTLLNVMKNVFSDNLLSKLTENETKTFGKLSRWEKVLKFEDKTDSNSNMAIEYGFSLRGVDRQQGFLTLKTQIRSAVPNIPTSDIPEVLQQLNHILDNAFHWCIKPEIIDIMKES